MKSIQNDNQFFKIQNFPKKSSDRRSVGGVFGIWKTLWPRGIFIACWRRYCT